MNRAFGAKHVLAPPANFREPSGLKRPTRARAVPTTSHAKHNRDELLSARMQVQGRRGYVFSVVTAFWLSLGTRANIARHGIARLGHIVTTGRVGRAEAHPSETPSTP